MAKKPLTDEEVVELFSELDESGVVDLERKAARESGGKRGPRARRRKVDPLSEDDPSGSRAGEAIGRTAVAVILGVFAFIMGMQVVYGVSRRLNTANLSEGASVDSVRHAMESGVEWGNGFTQFPEDFSVQEADESTGHIEVTVVDTASKNEMECLSGSQIQAAALSVNALLNPNINQVVYHVNVHVGDDGKFQQSSLFGFLKPTGNIKQFATFVWTKSTTADGGFNFTCMITGLDATSAENLRDKLTVQNNILDVIMPGASTGEAETDEAATTESLSAADAATAQAEVAAATAGDAATEQAGK